MLLTRKGNCTMATAKEKAKKVDELKKALSWDDYEVAEQFELELSNGLKLTVDALTAGKSLEIAATVGEKIVEIFEGTGPDDSLQKMVEVAIKKLDQKTIEELAAVIFNERRVANLPAGVLMDLVEQYVDKVGIKEVFSVAKKIQASLKGE